jgi:hypothetical protein
MSRDHTLCAWQVMKYANNVFEIIASASSHHRTCGNRQRSIQETEAALHRTSSCTVLRHRICNVWQLLHALYCHCPIFLPSDRAEIKDKA